MPLNVTFLQKMDKHEIIKKLCPYLDRQHLNEFLKVSGNKFFGKVKPEEIFQFFAVRILRQKGYIVVVLQKGEGQKGFVQQYKHKLAGHKRFVPDLLVVGQKGFIFLELKTKSPYKKDGSFKKNEQIEGQHKYMEVLKKANINVFCDFVYPELFIEKFCNEV